ncbi:MAG TPA: zinc ribbon domain-containing protein [Pyrinomonadaceae bacterium]|nr:zinc ribbon domain-containing protein [Pyrinomonadaceae bacterium]
MSEPEIARRCTACGVSVRPNAMFCPQCGNPIAKQETTNSTQTAPTQALHAVTLADHESTPAAPTQALHQPSPAPARSGVAENVRERVEKIKHVSHVVIDQAAYDPSLRFLLVAAALFLLFIVLVILSKVLG